MTKLNKSFSSLLGKFKNPCISIYLSFPESKIKFEIKAKNISDKIKDLLKEYSLSEKEIKSSIKRFQQTYKDISSEILPNKGIAIFISGDFCKHYILPFRVHENVLSGSNFYLKPILPCYCDEKCFYILALSQNHVRFLECDEYEAKELKLPNIPQTVDEAIGKDILEKQLQAHTSSIGVGAHGATTFHGHGVGKDHHADNILHFFRAVDKGLHSILKNQNYPLIVASVDYLLPLYREANSYAFILDEGILGSPEREQNQNLHKKALPIIRKYHQDKVEKENKRYIELGRDNLTSGVIEDIVPKAFNGKVDTLFITDVDEWGVFNLKTNSVSHHTSRKLKDEELTNLAAVHTLLHKGKVYMLPLDKMPVKASLAAILRY
ncbi:MAG: hypothetical protein HYZ79_04260 [Candidatus Melainabacteria bacterium]|nr:hypothetical protein [Candidatus Melainabacteria bacterium]